MFSASEKEAIDKGLVIMWIIWGAMLASLFIYVLVCHLTGNQIRQNIETSIPLVLLRNILYSVALLTLILSYFVRKSALAVRPSNTSQIGANSSQSSTQPVFIGKYTTAMIIALAFSESIGIYGVVLYFIGDSLKTLYTFIGVAALAMFFYRPKREDIETLGHNMRRNSSYTFMV